MYSLPVLNCDNCSACCMILWKGRPPFVEGEQLPDIPIIETEVDAPCCWLDVENKRCKHYDNRPNICRDFVISGDNCLTCRDKFSK